MTTGQKSLTWIVSLIVAYFIAAFPLAWPPFKKRPAVTTTVQLTTSSNICDANKREPEIYPKYGDSIYYHADANGPYTLDFDGHYPYKEGSNPITVSSNGSAGPFTSNVPKTATTALYKLTNNSNCKQASQDIGVIVKP